MTEQEHLIKKATFSQGEGNYKLALQLWDKAVRIGPFDHLSMLNRLLCIRELYPKRNQTNDALILLRNATTCRYFDQCVLFAMLCAFDSGQLELARKIAVIAAERARDAVIRANANVWDLPGEPLFVGPNGQTREQRSSQKIIRCLEAIVRDRSCDAQEDLLLHGFLCRHHDRDQAMKQQLRELPPKKAWWKFW